MKRLFILIFVMLSISPAYADHGHGSGGHGWEGGWVFPALVGGIIAYDLAYPYRYPYYPNPVYTQPYPVYATPYPVYTQPNTVYVQPAPAQPPAQFWYYCAAAKGYYPYVPNCPEGWKSVPAQPPQ